jgi:superfamily I DNA/RNA helicase
MSLDLHTLNREQLEAVLCTEGPLLVLAGAGSGKTRVITYRLAHLIENGIAPKNILCVTFTNKAAFEMRERAKKLVGKTVRGATMSTFHALGSKILREYGERVGLRPHFTICDGADQVGTLRRILRSLRIDDRKFDAKRIMANISRAKNAGMNAQDFRDQPEDLSLEEDFEGEYQIATIEAYTKYEENLRAQNVVDFDDLLLLTAKLLAENDDVLEKLRDRWRYLQVDEYQDTNGAQFDLMRMLAGEKRNLCVVGDDDQSIYGWRGADVENILSFGHIFPGATIVKLEMNYRSTGMILEVANSIIEKNPMRHDKTLRAAAGAGEPVKLVGMEDEDVEAEQVANGILALTAAQVPARDVAVLFRSNVQSRSLELAFRRAHIPYRVVGGMELFDRKEIKDTLAYLKILDNPEDEQSMRRVINFPPRGIGDTTIEKIDNWARANDLSLFEGLQRADQVPNVTQKSTDAIAVFLDILKTHRALLNKRKLSTVAKKLVEAVKLEAALLDTTDSGSTATRKVDNVREVIRQIERFEKKVDPARAEEAEKEELEGDLLLESEATLSGFLSDLALGAWHDGTSKEDREDQVVLSTIHAAKGLEWLHVFVVGAEEELLPHARTVDGEGGIEEERRLAYVAVTRARSHLTLSWAISRTKWGRIVPRKRSRFLDGLPEHAIEVREGDVKVARTEDEKEAIAKDWMAKIRSQLGINE